MIKHGNYTCKNPVRGCPHEAKLEVSASASNDLLCEKHNIKLECMGGCSAHRDNWYCPTCDREKELVAALKEAADVLLALWKTDYALSYNAIANKNT